LYVAFGITGNYALRAVIQSLIEQLQLALNSADKLGILPRLADVGTNQIRKQPFTVSEAAVAVPGHSNNQGALAGYRNAQGIFNIVQAEEVGVEAVAV
jgi:hypothetical protein